MAIIFSDGLDKYSVLADLQSVGYTLGSATFATTGGRFNGGRVYSTSSALTMNIPGFSAMTEVWSSVAMMFSAGATTGTFMIFYSPNNSEVHLQYDYSSGLISAYRYSTSIANLLGSASFPLTAGNWIRCDARVKCDSSTGEVEVWMNGTQLFNITGVNTKYTATTTGISYVQYGGSYIGFDDIVITDTTTGRLPDTRIITQRPTSDGPISNGTATPAGSHWSAVDDIGTGTSDYVTISNSAGQTELFGFSSLGVTPKTIYTVKAESWSNKTGTEPLVLKPTIKSSSTSSDGTGTNLYLTQTLTSSQWATDPNTSAAWTASAVNGLKAGVKVG